MFVLDILSLFTSSQGIFNIARALLTLYVNFYFISLEYERNHETKDLETFYDNSSIPKFATHKFSIGAKDLMVEREELQREK